MAHTRATGLGEGGVHGLMTPSTPWAWGRLCTCKADGRHGPRGGLCLGPFPAAGSTAQGHKGVFYLPESNEKHCPRVFRKYIPDTFVPSNVHMAITRPRLGVSPHGACPPQLTAALRSRWGGSDSRKSPPHPRVVVSVFLNFSGVV